MKATQFLRDAEDHLRSMRLADGTQFTLPTHDDFMDAVDILREAGKQAARARANALRRARHEAYTSCGLVRVKGALGGTYYE